MTFSPPAARPGFKVVTLRADKVRPGDRFIPMEGDDLPVGKGKTWRVCSGAEAIFGRTALSWGTRNYRWYLPMDPVFVMRPTKA